MFRLPATFGGAVYPQPGPARSWLERELSRPEYRRSLVDQLTGWLSDLWARLQSSALGGSLLSRLAATVVVVVLVVLVALVTARVRREPARPPVGDPVLVEGRRGPEEHRRAAEAALADGALDIAVVEAFRAVAVRAVRRGVVEERPGLTAHELADALAPVFPDQAGPLRAASALFDLVFYGSQPATAVDARSVLDLEDALRLARPRAVTP